MAATPDLVFYHSPNTRSSTTAVLLEALGAPYAMHVLDNNKGENRQPAYLAVNPLGKVPAIVHRGQLITETVAIFIHLADAFPAAGLAPALTDPMRGPFLRWMVYYAAAFEPAVVDRAMKREPAPLAMSTYGDFDSMLKTLTDHLDADTYMLGDRYSAADILWAMGLGWTTMFGIVPKTPTIESYLARAKTGPAFAKVQAMDAELSAKFAAS